MNIALLTKAKYAKYDNWYTFYRNGHDLSDILYDSSWFILFAIIVNDPKFDRTNDTLKNLVKTNNKLKIYPSPSHTFASFVATPADKLSVVILGQDPYFNGEQYLGVNVPQAMGLSFSVADGFAIPSSLDNIYNNLIKYKHIKEKPKSGNLWYWAYQGVLLFNTALTVEDGKKKSHTDHWTWFTKHVIRYISDNMDGIIFVLWGGDAYYNINLIDVDRHHTIVSSHPSGLSANKPFRNFPPFMNQDHFGMINNILVKTGRRGILWN